MHKSNITLVKPTIDLKSAFLAMVDEYRVLRETATYTLSRDITALAANCHSAGNQLYREGLDRCETFEAYVRRLNDYAHGLNVPDGYVPSSTFWLVRDGQTVLGCSRLRHRLTPALEHEGGHIGYDIRPSERRKGYGTRVLSLTLAKALEIGITRVLVTCASDNMASAKIIQKNGGVFAGEVVASHTPKPVSRYWIDLNG